MDTDNNPTKEPDGSNTDSDKSVTPTNEIEALRKRAEQAEAEAAKFRKAAQERDAAKKREREEAEKAGEHLKVIESLKAENESLVAKVADYDAKTARIEEMEKQHREELLSQLPDDVKDDAKDLDINAIKIMLKALPKVTPVNTDKGKVSTPKNGEADVMQIPGGEFIEWCQDKTPSQIQEATRQRSRLHW